MYCKQGLQYTVGVFTLLCPPINLIQIFTLHKHQGISVWPTVHASSMFAFPPSPNSDFVTERICGSSNSVLNPPGFTSLLVWVNLLCELSVRLSYVYLRIYHPTCVTLRACTSKNDVLNMNFGTVDCVHSVKTWVNALRCLRLSRRLACLHKGIRVQMRKQRGCDFVIVSRGMWMIILKWNPGTTRTIEGED